MKAVKRILCLGFAAMVVLSLNTTAMAVNLAGDEVVYCNATILITDQTSGYVGDQIKVTFKDVTGTSVKEITLVPANWLALRELKVSLPAPTTYNITFEGIEDGYKILSMALPSKPSLRQPRERRVSIGLSYLTRVMMQTV